MVYTRPSRGCQACKTRRVKCDQTRPSCENCTSLGRECPGVPDAFEIIHRDRSKKAAKDVKKRVASAIQAREASINEIKKSSSTSPKARRASKSLSNSSGEFCFQVLPQPDFHVKGFYEDLAIRHLFNHFMRPSKKPIGVGHYLVCLEQLFRDTKPDSALDSITRALAIISFAHKHDTPSIKPEAHRRYGECLSKLRSDLRHIEQCVSDETIMTLLLLVFYEGLDPPDRGPSAREKHLGAALFLLRLRGACQKDSATSLKLFRAVRGMVTMQCAVMSKPMPEFDGVLPWDFDRLEPGAFSNGCAGRLLLHLPELRARAKLLLHEAPQSTTAQDVNELMQKSQALDIMFEDFIREAPDTWQPQSIPCFAIETESFVNAVVWPGLVFKHEDPFAIYVFNSCRTARLLLQGIICQCYEWLANAANSWTFQPQQTRCHSTLQQIVDDICSTVPQVMGADLDALAFPSEQVPKREDAETKPDSLGPNLLLVPLYVASNVEIVPRIQRAWILARMRAIADEHGFMIGRTWSASRMTVAGKGRARETSFTSFECGSSRGSSHD